MKKLTKQQKAVLQKGFQMLATGATVAARFVRDSDKEENIYELLQGQIDTMIILASEISKSLAEASAADGLLEKVAESRTRVDRRGLRLIKG